MADVTVATLKTVFTADTVDFERGKRKVESGLDNVGSKISGIGSGFTGLGTTLSFASAPIIGAFGLATNAALGFGTQMTNIQAVTGQSNEEIAALGNTLIDTESKFSNVELATTFYDIAGGVTDVNARMDVYNAAISAAQAGNSNLQATTAVLITSVNSYGAEVLSAAEASDIFTRAVGMGVGTADQFAAAFPSVIGIAAAVGVSFEELGAATAFLTTKGATASDATTQLGAVINALLKPNADMIAAFEAAGIESGSLALEQHGLAGTLELLDEAFGGNIDLMTQALGTQEALRAAVALTADANTAFTGSFDSTNIHSFMATGTEFSAFAKVFGKDLEGLTERTEAIQMMDPAAQFALLRNEANDLQVVVGEALVPSLVTLSQDVKPLVRQFRDWAKANPAVIRNVALLTVGAVALGSAFVVLGTVLSGAVTVFTAVGIGLAFLLSPIGLVAAGILALGAAFYWAYNNNILGFGDAIKGVVANLKELKDTAADAFSGGIDVQGMVDSLSSRAGLFIGAAAVFATNFWTGFKAEVIGLIPGSLTGIKDAIITEAEALFAGGLNLNSGALDLGLDLTSIGGVIAAFSKLSTAVGLVTTAFGLLTSPIGLVIAGLALLGGAFYIAYSENIFGFRDAVNDLAPVLQAGAIEIAKFTGKVVAGFQQGGVAGAAQAFVSQISAAIPDVKLAANQLGAASVDGTSEGVKQNSPALREATGAMWASTREEAPKAAEAGGFMAGQFVTTLAAVMIQHGPAAVLSMLYLGGQIIRIGQTVVIPQMLGLGKDVVVGFATGFLEGVLSKSPEIGFALKDLGEQGSKALDEGMGDVGAWVGTDIVDPIVNKLNASIPSIAAAAGGMAAAIMGPFNSIIGKAAEVLDKLGLVNSASGGNNPWVAAVTATQNAVNNASGNQPPGRAIGGPVMANQPYIVGEKGPELFVPSQGGDIIPNGALQGGRGGGSSEPPIHIEAIYIYGIPNPREVLDIVVAEAKRRGRSPIVLAGAS